MSLRLSLFCWSGLALFSSLASSAVMAQENGNGNGNGVGGIHFSDLTGHISFRYILNEQGTAQSGTTSSDESRPSYEEELFLRTLGYVYHPNLMKFDIGGGVMGVQSEYNSLTVNEEYSDTVYNGIVRLNFFEQKPFPFLLFYEHLNPSVTPGIGQSYVQQNERHGFDLSLREPFFPVTTNISGSVQTSEGEGFDIVVDDVTSQAALRLQKHFSGGSFIQYSELWSKLVSNSGNPDLPIVETITENLTNSLSSRLVFGGDKQGQFDLIGSYNTQNQSIDAVASPTRKHKSVAPGLNWRHSDFWRSSMYYTLSETSEQDIETKVQSGKIGTGRHTSDGFNAAIDVHGDRDETEGFVRSSSGVGLSLGYHYPFSWGKFTIGAAGQLDRKDQDADLAFINVFGEQVTLTGTTPVTLGHSFVVPGSVVVENLARTQTYVLGVDYQLTVVGSRTQVERLIGGNILDGQDVLVDYQYETGGTIEYDDVKQTYQASLDVLRYLKLYVRQYRVGQKVREGSSSIILNDVVSNGYGASFNTVFWQSWLFGAEVDVVDQEEDIASYESTFYQSYLQFPLPFYSSLRVNGKRNIVDNIGSDIDVDLTGYGLTLTSRPWLRAQLNVESTYEEDVGAPTIRERWGRSVNFSWLIRKLTVTVEGRYSRERQGDYERDQTAVRAQIRRDI